MKKLLIYTLLTLFLILPMSKVKAYEEEVQGIVTKTTENSIKVKITSESPLKGKTINISTADNMELEQDKTFKNGDKLLLTHTKDTNNNDMFIITDYIRSNELAWLMLIFLTVVVVVTKWQGISSLIGMVFSFLIIFKFIVPFILKGYDPILISLIGSALIIPLTFYLSHGFNRKTTLAITGTIASLIITGFLAQIFITATKITGYANEEISFLQTYRPNTINITDLLIAAIIIGALGVLDDVTVSQSAIVRQLKQANPKLKFDELYKLSMKVGRDHISSMVNTLILVYASSSLPLLLLFMDNKHSLISIINHEIVAEEIVRTLVGSTGLILAIPITTFAAVWSFTKKPPQTKD